MRLVVAIALALVPACSASHGPSACTPGDVRGCTTRFYRSCERERCQPTGAWGPCESISCDTDAGVDAAASDDAAGAACRWLCASCSTSSDCCGPFFCWMGRCQNSGPVCGPDG